MEELLNHLASPGKRLGAYLLDMIPIIILVMIIFFAFFDLTETMNAYIENIDDEEVRLDFLRTRDMIRNLSLSIWIIYCIVMESSARQATFGKLAMGIKVVDEFGQPLTLQRSAARNISKILSFIVFSLGFIWIIFDRKRQGWHDKLGRTFVVDKTFEPTDPEIVSEVLVS